MLFSSSKLSKTTNHGGGVGGVVDRSFTENNKHKKHEMDQMQKDERKMLKEQQKLMVRRIEIIFVQNKLNRMTCGSCKYKFIFLRSESSVKVVTTS